MGRVGRLLTVGLLEDVVGAFGPYERMTSVVPAVDKSADFGVEVCDRAEGDAVDCLALDDFLSTPISSATAAELLNILAAREGKGATVVASQFDPEDWYKSLHDAVIAESILNRIVSAADSCNSTVQTCAAHANAHSDANTSNGNHTKTD